jgi:hypothetical protein
MSRLNRAGSSGGGVDPEVWLPNRQKGGKALLRFVAAGGGGAGITRCHLKQVGSCGWMGAQGRLAPSLFGGFANVTWVGCFGT